jgi:hypothetical protein
MIINSKYRIVHEQLNGNDLYYLQKRFLWLFWRDLYMDYGGLAYLRYEFTSLEKAKECLTDLLAKKEKVKKQYIIN